MPIDSEGRLRDEDINFKQPNNAEPSQPKPKDPEKVVSGLGTSLLITDAVERRNISEMNQALESRDLDSLRKYNQSITGLAHKIDQLRLNDIFGKSSEYDAGFKEDLGVAERLSGYAVDAEGLTRYMNAIRSGDTMRISELAHRALDTAQTALNDELLPQPIRSSLAQEFTKIAELATGEPDNSRLDDLELQVDRTLVVTSETLYNQIEKLIPPSIRHQYVADQMTKIDQFLQDNPNHPNRDRSLKKRELLSIAQERLNSTNQ